MNIIRTNMREGFDFDLDRVSNKDSMRNWYNLCLAIVNDAIESKDYEFFLSEDKEVVRVRRLYLDMILLGYDFGIANDDNCGVDTMESKLKEWAIMSRNNLLRNTPSIFDL